jgi:gamma-glutamylputrescine oxidase
MTSPLWIRGGIQCASDLKADVLIIGGGYTGLSTAWWLSEFDPKLKIIVIDRGQCGAGASGRNAGFFTMGSAAFYKTLFLDWGKERAQEIFHFAHKSLEDATTHLLKNSSGINYEEAPSLTLLRHEGTIKDWKEAGFHPEDFSFKWKPQGELPEPLNDTFIGAYESLPEHKINPQELLNYLKIILGKRNITILENESVSHIQKNRVMTELRSIEAQTKVLALNGYFPKFHPSFESLIMPRRAQMLAIEFDGPLNCPHLYYDPQDRVYWRKISENRLVVGGKRLLDEKGETGEFEKLSGVIQNALEDYLKDTLKLNFKIVARWSGIMAFTKHELPFVTKLASESQTYLMGGFSGHGMGFGFGAAREMAELIIGKKNESFFDKFGNINTTL